MTIPEVFICVAIIAFVALIIGALYQLFFDLFKRKEEEEVVTFHPGTGDPQFDELALLTQDVIDGTKEFVGDVRKSIASVEKQNKQLLESSLRLQRLEITLELLDKITFDNVMKYFPSDGLQWFTVGMVVHYVRKKIRELSGE